MTINIFTDGASRGNPGDAGAGVVIFDGKLTKHKIFEYLGKKTNNEAEYLAVIYALKYLKENNIKIANLYSDSQFLVKQLNGEYKVKSEKIIPLYSQVKSYLNEIKIKFTWIRREDNSIADSLANDGIDLKKSNLKSKKDFSIDSNSVSSSNALSFRNNLKLKLDKAFFGKINCLKIQMNNENEVYFHMGIKKSNLWVWEKVKVNEMELGEIIHTLNKDMGKCSFYHSFGNKKTQIWCNKNENNFSIKIKDISKNLNIGEFEILKIILKQIIILKSFNYN